MLLCWAADHRNDLFLERSPPLKEEESAARLLTEHPGCLWVGCLVCHSGSVMSPLTRKRGWPDYRGRPESQKGALWDSGCTWGKDWEPPWRGAGRRSGRSQSLARGCTRSGWPSKQACRGLKISTQTGNQIRFRLHWQTLTISLMVFPKAPVKPDQKSVFSKSTKHCNNVNYSFTCKSTQPGGGARGKWCNATLHSLFLKFLSSIG